MQTKPHEAIIFDKLAEMPTVNYYLNETAKLEYQIRMNEKGLTGCENDRVEGFKAAIDACKERLTECQRLLGIEVFRMWFATPKDA